MKTDSSVDNPVIELYSGTLWEAEMLHTLLNDSGIGSFVKNNVIQPYPYNPTGAMGVKVMVLQSDLPEAGKVLTAYLENLQG